MKLRYFIGVLLTLLCVCSTVAQERRMVQGKVVARYRDLEGVYIENITSRNNTTTEKGGYFKIEIQPNDTLIFASVNLNGIRKVITETDFTNKLLFVPMEVSDNNTLDELVIERKITAESLGLAARKKYTPAEKRLFTATSSAGGIVAIDALINSISGRTAMLKKALQYEREELVMKKIIQTFEVDFFTTQLKIPEKYIEGFGYYIIQDSNIINAFNNSEREQLKFLLTQKAVEFNRMIKVFPK